MSEASELEGTKQKMSRKACSFLTSHIGFYFGQFSLEFSLSFSSAKVTEIMQSLFSEVTLGELRKSTENEDKFIIQLLCHKSGGSLKYVRTVC